MQKITKSCLLQPQQQLGLGRIQSHCAKIKIPFAFNQFAADLKKEAEKKI